MHRRRTLTAALTVLALGAFLAVTRAADARTVAAQPPGAAGIGPVVTLITGDRIHVLRQPDGEVSVGVEPAPGRADIGFQRLAGIGKDVSVIPADAAPLLAAGRLDPRLFNVTELVREGYTDAVPTLPLIVTYDTGAVRPMATARAATTVRALPSINGAGVRQEKRQGSAFWTWLTGSHRLPAGIRKVWLDARSHPALDVSVPQIGAPAAWALGFTGKGVTVGVLDTGIKADHPDLAGKVVEAKDFTDTSPDASDDVGHGTHVAGIIAGTGAASNGRFRGVAPDANLVSGKVYGRRLPGLRDHRGHGMDRAEGTRGEHEPRRQLQRRHRPGIARGEHADGAVRHAVRHRGRQQRHPGPGVHTGQR